MMGGPLLVEAVSSNSVLEVQIVDTNRGMFGNAQGRARARRVQSGSLAYRSFHRKS